VFNPNDPAFNSFQRDFLIKNAKPCQSPVALYGGLSYFAIMAGLLSTYAYDPNILPVWAVNILFGVLFVSYLCLLLMNFILSVASIGWFMMEDYRKYKTVLKLEKNRPIRNNLSVLLQVVTIAALLAAGQFFLGGLYIVLYGSAYFFGILFNSCVKDFVCTLDETKVKELEFTLQQVGSKNDKCS